LGSAGGRVLASYAANLRVLLYWVILIALESFFVHL
jgi:hypothetical protein